MASDRGVQALLLDSLERDGERARLEVVGDLRNRLAAGADPALAPVQQRERASRAERPGLPRAPAHARSLIATAHTPAGPPSAFCALSAVRSRSHASISSGSAPTEATASTSTSAPACVRAPGDLRDRAARAGRRLGVHEADDVDVAALECRLHFVHANAAPAARRRCSRRLAPAAASQRPSAAPYGLVITFTARAPGAPSAAGHRLERDDRLALQQDHVARRAARARAVAPRCAAYSRASTTSGRGAGGAHRASSSCVGLVC